MQTKNTQKKIKITLSKNEMDAIEDQFFCKLTEKQHMKIRPKLLSIWKKLCNEMESINNK